MFQSFRKEFKKKAGSRVDEELMRVDEEWMRNGRMSFGTAWKNYEGIGSRGGGGGLRVMAV